LEKSGACGVASNDLIDDLVFPAGGDDDRLYATVHRYSNQIIYNHNF
jgi:hypothetical protein